MSTTIGKIGEQLATLLNGDAGLIALAAEASWTAARRGAILPYIVLHADGGDLDQHSGGSGGLFRAGVESSVYASTESAAFDVTDKLVDALLGYSAGSADYRIDNVELEELPRSAPYRHDGDEEIRHRVITDWTVSYRGPI